MLNCVIIWGRRNNDNNSTKNKDNICALLFKLQNTESLMDFESIYFKKMKKNFKINPLKFVQ